MADNQQKTSQAVKPHKQMAMGVKYDGKKVPGTPPPKSKCPA